jgi:serine-type anaerobic sulfatase-maturating enzyme
MASALATPPPRAFHILAKPTGPICNLDCKYCFYLEKEVLYPDVAKWAMPPQVLDSYIRQYIEQQQSSTIQFTWQGGEPTLLGVDFFRRVVELQSRYAAGKRIENAFQTNGILLNDEWADFFAEHSFLIGVSIDGPREFHDAYRVDKGGAPTFHRVLRGIDVLRRRNVAFNTLTTVHRANSAHPLEVYRFLRDNGSGFLQFIPIVERVSPRVTSEGLTLVSPSSSQDAAVSAWSVDPVQYGRFLCAIFDEWVRNDVGRTFVQLFDVSLEMWTGLASSLCVFRPTCGSALALEHNGDLYSCDHFVYPENRLGNIMQAPLAQMISSPQQIQFGQDKLNTLPQYCRQCEVRFACNGECPKHRFAKTPDGEPGLNYLCAAYKRFFTHIDPYMRFMAEELGHQRPPANVMQWARARDLQASAPGKPGRNELCPCGSGLKFKRCCGRA